MARVLWIFIDGEGMISYTTMRCEDARGELEFAWPKLGVCNHGRVNLGSFFYGPKKKSGQPLAHCTVCRLSARLLLEY